MDELTVVEHLEELRRRIIVAISALIAASCLSFPFASRILTIIQSPSAGLIDKLAFFSPQEALVVHVKISVCTGIVISMPVLLYEIWAFLSPALENKRKVHVVAFLTASMCAFIAGSAFGFFVIIPPVLRFLLGFSNSALEPVISISHYTSFVTVLVLGCGVIFEMPVVSYILSKIGIINPKVLRRGWKYAVVGIFIIAAIVTPTPDAFTMVVLAIPMLFLYELSIWVAWCAYPRRP